MRHIVVRPVVAPFARRELDSIDEFDVGAVVELVSVTGGGVFDQKPDGASTAGRQGTAGETVDD